LVFPHILLRVVCSAFPFVKLSENSFFIHTILLQSLLTYRLVWKLSQMYVSCGVRLIAYLAYIGLIQKRVEASTTSPLVF
jgi:hypothetical protein